MKLKSKILSISLLGLACLSMLSCNQKSEANQKNISKDDATIVKVFQTAKSTEDRLTSQNDIVLMEDSFQNMAYVNVDVNHQFQTIVGIGGAFTESAAYNYSKLSEPKKKKLIDMYFDPETGNGYTLGRVHINSCDFSLESWACDTVEGDTLLKYFNIERDHKYIIPFVKEAMKVANNNITLYASPWSPPKWMKTNNDMCRGGQLKTEYRNAWALHYTKFIKAYRELGLNMWAITVQNEPAAWQVWESCLYSAEEERDFVKNHLGPVMEKEGLKDVKIIVWDHNRDISYERVAPIYDDPEASKYVWGAGIHWYNGDHFDDVLAIHDAYPNKNILFTEGCQESGPHFGEWQVGERYGKSIINDFNSWVVGWTDWNLVLDMQGGPNHVGNFCSAPLHVDAENDSIIVNNSYYYLGHFSRFIKPGARRITCTTTKDELEITAFINTDNKVAVVVMNRTDGDIDFALRFKGKAAKTKSLAHSIVTYVF